MIVDLENARVLAERALSNINRIDGTDTDADVGQTKSRGDSRIADMNRRLQFTSHLLRRCADELEAQYWVTRGFPDLLAEET